MLQTTLNVWISKNHIMFVGNNMLNILSLIFGHKFWYIIRFHAYLSLQRRSTFEILWKNLLYYSINAHTRIKCFGCKFIRIFSFMSLGRNEMKMIPAGNEKKVVSKRNMGFHGHLCFRMVDYHEVNIKHSIWLMAM